MMRRFLLMSVLVALACTAERAAGPRGRVRVVLVVADGAGTAYWSAAKLFADSLAVLGFPVTGLMDPGNTSYPEPESASSATAFATGVRTYYHGLGVGPDGVARRSVLEAAEAAGLATGLVTTTDIVDATPAAFAAHVATRGQYEEIARQMVGSGVEVLLGDGRRYFSPATRADSLDLIGDLRARYTLVEQPADLARAAAQPGVERLAGFFDIDSVMDPARRRPTLSEMAAAALAVVARDPDGFFLVIENEHTDHSGHRNAPLERIAAEVIEVDRAVQEALEYRATHPETLVVVLGDHETGGLSIRWDADTGRWVAAWSNTGHTPILVPVFALGPGAERFAGVHTNAEVGRILLDLVAGAEPARFIAD